MSGHAAIETHVSGRATIEISNPKRAQTTQDIYFAAAAATIIPAPTNDSREDDDYDITQPSTAHVNKQAKINTRRAALRDTDYSVEDESTAANNK